MQSKPVNDKFSHTARGGGIPIPHRSQPIYMASQASGGSKQSAMKVEVNERIVQEYLLDSLKSSLRKGRLDVGVLWRSTVSHFRDYPPIRLKTIVMRRDARAV